MNADLFNPDWDPFEEDDRWERIYGDVSPLSASTFGFLSETE